MPTVITPLSSGAIVYTANCYVSLAETDLYFTNDLEGLWWLGESIETPQREMAIISATRAIEHLLDGQDADKFDGITTDARPKGQPLQFPRAWDRNGSGTLVILPDLKEGTYLLALHLLKVALGAAGVIDGENMARQGISSSSADGISANRQWPSWSEWPREVKRLIGLNFWQRMAVAAEGPVTRRSRYAGWVAE